MNKLCYIIVILLSCKICNAQNLVPNGDFESHSQLPTGSGQFSLCTGWSNCGGYGSPDYYHLLGTGLGQLPNSFVSTIYPHGGSAIMGLDLYAGTHANFREYISRQLLSPLVVGQAYQLSFYITNGTPPIYYGGYGCDHFSVAFSTVPLSQTTPLIINYTPQCIYNGFLYNNSWQQVTFNFTADSAYQHITFGSFVDDAMQQVQLFDTALTAFHAYYLIDDVYLEMSTGIDEDANLKNNISVFPTLFSDKLNVLCSNFFPQEIILYDISSKKVIQQKFTNSISLSTKQLAKGLYLYEIRNQNNVVKKGKVIKE